MDAKPNNDQAKAPNTRTDDKTAGANAPITRAALARALGPWAQTMHHTFNWRQRRADTVFATPHFDVLQTCWMGSFDMQYRLKVGGPISLISGLPESRRQTMTPGGGEGEKTTGWLALLYALQEMESNSQRWHTEQHFLDVPEDVPEDVPKKVPADERGRMPQYDSPKGIAAHVLPQQYRWHSGHKAIKKSERHSQNHQNDHNHNAGGNPCASSFVKDLVVLAAMLGMTWTLFDVDRHRYRAVGNGYELTGAHRPGETRDRPRCEPDVCFTFRKVGPNTQPAAARMIPDYRAPFLSLGHFTSTFLESFGRSFRERSCYSDPTTIQRSVYFRHSFCIATDAALVKVLRYPLHVPRDAADLVTKAGGGHIFPLHFALMGMVGDVVHVPGSYFRFLPDPNPNPTGGRPWDGQQYAASFPLLLAEFKVRLLAMPARPPADPLDPSSRPRLSVARTCGVLDLLDDETVALLSNDATCHRMPGIKRLRAILDECDEFLGPGRHIFTAHVVGLHFTKLLRLLGGDDNTSSTSGRKMAEIDSESSASAPAQRLMELYFEHVLPFVAADGDWGLQQGPAAVAAGRARLDEWHQRQRLPLNATNDAGWFWLVLRMLCWLRLHDFKGGEAKRAHIDQIFPRDTRACILA